MEVYLKLRLCSLFTYVYFLYSSSMRGQAGDIPPDGPVDLEELERNLPPLLPQVYI